MYRLWLHENRIAGLSFNISEKTLSRLKPSICLTSAFFANGANLAVKDSDLKDSNWSEVFYFYTLNDLRLTHECILTGPLLEGLTKVVDKTLDDA